MKLPCPFVYPATCSLVCVWAGEHVATYVQSSYLTDKNGVIDMRGVFSGEKQTSKSSNQAQQLLKTINGNKLRDSVAVVLSSGAAVMLASTRDGGAIVITLLDGNDKGKVYVTNMAEFEEALQDMALSFSK